MQTKTAKVAILEQLKVHTSTSALHSETRCTGTGAGLCASKHASKEHASSYGNSCRSLIHGGNSWSGAMRAALRFVPNLNPNWVVCVPRRPPTNSSASASTRGHTVRRRLPAPRHQALKSDLPGGVNFIPSFIGRQKCQKWNRLCCHWYLL